MPEPPCEIDPITPTFFVDVNTDLEVCPGDIFEAYATENVGEGFYRHEWIFPSNVMQLAPGYSKYQSHVEFEATGGAGSAMHIQLNAYYRCVSVDRCTGAVTRRSAVRTSTIWGGNIQNCSGSGPKI
ncbi:MAG: hypothetical protein R8G66_04680 [Cytophagales bacterium]|nr:hypothetical protein [Cytophagales bacterium]